MLTHMQGRFSSSTPFRTPAYTSGDEVLKSNAPEASSDSSTISEASGPGLEGSRTGTLEMREPISPQPQRISQRRAHHHSQKVANMMNVSSTQISRPDPSGRMDLWARVGGPSDRYPRNPRARTSRTPRNQAKTRTPPFSEG